jgi:1,4-dihydroxy-2-naphthoate octaprenyltransferase
MHDPQDLDFVGSIRALIALGRISLACEVPLSTLLGCVLASQIFPSSTSSSNSIFSNLNGWVTLQCMLVTWGTNVAINYGNEWFDYALDTPSQQESIRRDVNLREALAKRAKGEAGGEYREEAAKQANSKLYGNTTRIIHDGTFPPWTALACCAVWQAALVALIIFSRAADPALSGASLENGARTPFRGLALHLGIMCTILSHSYVGPPLRLHYNGFGELVSALFLSPVAVLFGLVGHYTASTGRPVAWSDLFTSNLPTPSGFTLDKSLWLLLGALYFNEQARIFVMHIHDIGDDIAGGKRTFVSRIGHRRAKDLYVVFNVLSVALFGLLARTLSRESYGDGKSLIGRAGGKMLPLRARSSAGLVWIGGLVVLLSCALPVIFTTYRVLVAEIPQATAPSADVPDALPDTSLKHGVTDTAEPALRSFHGRPVQDGGKVHEPSRKAGGISMGDCLKLVSLQTLATPAVLTITALLAAYVGQRAEKTDAYLH